MPREIRYLPIAQQDLLDIVDWISSDSLARAQTWIESLDKRVQALAKMPSLGRLPKSEGLQKAGYRVLILDDYLVFYVAREAGIMIHRVIHGSRSLDSIV